MRALLAAGTLAVLLAPLAAGARPLYFQNLTSIYSIAPGEDIYACGVCHQRWEGTGGRNPYGTAVEQQLYVGKSIVQAIMDVANDDSDGDGFTNGDELGTYRTLPGYSCSNFDIALNPPANFQSLITPGVPSCLEPKDIKVAPTTVSFVTLVGDTRSITVSIQNNGSSFPLEVTGVALLPGAPSTLTVSAPAVPFSIPLGESVSVDLSFSPTAGLVGSATLRITSDDPGESPLDVPINLLSFVRPLAPPAVRGACLKDVEKQLERLAKARLGAWGTCYLDELRGVACDTVRRDRSVSKAELKLRAIGGGDKDTHCAAQSLSTSLLGLPMQCGAPCDAIHLSTIPTLADCAVCRATSATDAMLSAAIGTAPPDLPANRLGPSAWRCNNQLVTGITNGVRAVQKTLGRCELEAALAGTSADCSAEEAASLADAAEAVNVRVQRCTDTTGMLGCLFLPGADPGCLGDAAVQIGTDLVETIFGAD